MLRFSALLVFILAGSPALAGATEWQDVAPGARMRLISSDFLQPDGSTLVALEFDIEPEMKTYWRVPGETGIPTQIDIAGSGGIAKARILWPFPERETEFGYVDHVYYGSTVLPIALDLDSDNPRLEMSVLTGICWDICVPATASFDLDFELGSPDVAQSLRIDQALAEVPMPWPGASPVGEVVYDDQSGALEVELLDPGFDMTGVIADIGQPGLLFGPPQKSPIGGVWTFPMLGRVPSEGLHDGPVRLSFRTPEGAFEIARQIGEKAPST